MSFGSWLLDEITHREWTQTEFARRVGVSPQAVNRWVQDKDLPQGPQIIAIAKALGVKPALVLSHFPEADPLDEEEVFYANMPGPLTDEEKRGILAYIRGMRGSKQ